MIDWPFVRWGSRAVQIDRSLRVGIGLEAEKVHTCCVEMMVCPDLMVDIVEVDMTEQRSGIQQISGIA